MKHSTSYIEVEREKLEFLYRQPAKKQAKGDYLAPFKNFWQKVVNYLNTNNELQIWQSSDRYGRKWWNAYDPFTGRIAKRDSENEMRVWIEQRYYQ